MSALVRVRPYATFTCMEEAELVKGWNRAGDAIDAAGRPIGNIQTLKIHLQDGKFFGDDDKPYTGPIPKQVQLSFERAKKENPQPGITHPCVVIKCPAPGCGFQTNAQAFFEGHKRSHSDIDDSEWQRLLGLSSGGKKPSPYTMSDFARPTEEVRKKFAPEEGPVSPVSTDDTQGGES